MADSPNRDDTNLLLTAAIALIRQWKFMIENPLVVLTPRQTDELRQDREQWLEGAERWAKNKPEYQVP